MKALVERVEDEKINEFIDVIILGAGAPSIGKTPLH